MCELMTITAAIIFTVLYFKVLRTPAVLTTMLMFWGAALMWSVDCVHSAMEGEGLFDLSFEDMQLGFIIIAFGLALFGVLLFVERLGIERRTDTQQLEDALP
ncbi:MAG: hypothetical protein J6V72_02725 [Kiritimatiellae bacterium]|nr:hypothetical protein [Kiritimatiellia bacterium]